jgi:hypothetical protein
VAAVRPLVSSPESEPPGAGLQRSVSWIGGFVRPGRRTGSGPPSVVEAEAWLSLPTPGSQLGPERVHAWRNITGWGISSTGGVIPPPSPHLGGSNGNGLGLKPDSTKSGTATFSRRNLQGSQYRRSKLCRIRPWSVDWFRISRDGRRGEHSSSH